MATNPSVIEIHTSDRGTFKRCRRKFGWGSTLRDNLYRVGPDNSNFFLGTGFHFALEDYHGYRRFEHPALAYAAYHEAQDDDDMPENADDLLDLATGMLWYYADEWLPQHPEPYETLWVTNEAGVLIPQVEVEVAVDITQLVHDSLPTHHEANTVGWDLDSFKIWLEDNWGGDEIHYVTTYDRVTIDKHERIWGIDYKTAASFDELNLQTNPQAGSYDWSMDLFYTPAGFTVAGMVWQQHKKAVPKPPKLVNVGKKNEGLSLDYGQATTFNLYKRAVKDRYGTIPEQYTDILAAFGNAQSEEGDAFVRRDPMRRNPQQRETEQAKIVAEVIDMLDPYLALYPNPTKDCSWDCPFKSPCLAMDDGSDFEHLLREEYVQWQGYKDSWRKRIKYPSAAVATNA